MITSAEIETLQDALDNLEIQISKEESAVAERELKYLHQGGVSITPLLDRKLKAMKTSLEELKVERERRIHKIAEAQKF